MNIKVAELEPMPKHQTTPSVVEFAGEMSDLAVGAGLPLFVLSPFALPALALAALAAVALLISPLVCAVLCADTAGGALAAAARSHIPAGRQDHDRDPRRAERHSQARHGVTACASELA